MSRLSIWTLGFLCIGVCSIPGCNRESYFCDSKGCYICDALGCRDAKPPQRKTCIGDTECTGSAACTSIGCVERCSTDKDCPKGTVCEPTSKLCLGPTETLPNLTPGTCQKTSDCGDASLICKDGLCTRLHSDCGGGTCSCEDDPTLCATGFLCVDKLCRAEDDLCQFNNECSPGSVCIDGRCLKGCTLDSECLSGQRCQSNVCEDIPPTTNQCTHNTDCPTGNVCVDTSCVPGCTQDSECGTGKYCANGICRTDDRPKPFCMDDSGCRAGHPCVGGVCRTPCNKDSECPLFDRQFTACRQNYCVTEHEATTNCVVSGNCVAGRECVDGVCR